MTAELTLPEQVLLLCLNDTTGRPEEVWLRFGLTGAVIAELMLLGRVGLEDDEQLVVRDATPPGDPLLDQALGEIAKRPRKLREWISRGVIPNSPLKSHPVLTETLADGLVQRGILSRKDDRFVWVIPYPTFPAQDPKPEQGLREQVRGAILGDGPVEDRLAVLIALLHGAEALDRVLTPEEVAGSKDRVKQICDGTATSRGSGTGVAGAVEEDRAQSSVVTALILGDMLGEVLRTVFP